MPSSVPSDGKLIEDFVRGRPTAFDALVRRYQPEVYGFLLRMVRDDALADDLFQETFVRIMNALPAYTEKGRFRSWLFSVARNLALDAIRKGKFERGLFVRQDRENRDDSRHEIADGVADEGSAPDSAIERRELAEQLDLAIAGLPAPQREVLMLRHNADLTFREIAEITGDSINTVMGRMRYATSALRKQLAPLMAEDKA